MDTITFLMCFAPVGVLVGITMWLAWRDIDKFD
jgi:hypothetical protein